MASALHNHSEYSVLDGFSHPKEYLERAKEIGLKNVTFNMDDTITNDLYYSNSEARIRSCKMGRQFEGIYFNEESRKK